MAAGFQCYNDTGFIQIDGDFSNYALLAKGTTYLGANSIWLGTSGAGDVTTGTNYVDITFTARQPLFAYSCAAPVAQFTCVNNNNGTWTVRLQSLTPQNVDWYVFDQTPAVTGSTFGAQVFDATGRLVFDANYPYAKIIGNLSGRIALPGDDFGQYAFPGESSTPYYFGGQSKLAVGAVLTPITTLSSASIYEGSWSGILGVGGWSTGADYVVRSFYHWRFGPRAPSAPAYNYDFGSSLRWGALVLDVTAI